VPQSKLQHKAVSATLWSGIDAFARQGLQFVVSLILARLLTPQDFGTVGLLAIFIGLAGVFIDSGFSFALIQRKEISDIDLSSVFFFNISISLLAAALLCLSAPGIAAFFAMPVLKPLTWLLAANVVIGSFGAIQGLLLTKALNFRRQCIISLAAQFVSGAVAVLLAWRQYGVWSLGVQTLLATIIGTTLLWVSSSWRPRWVFSITAIRSLFRFGSFLLLSGLLDTLFNRLTSLVIGKFYSAKDLGYYSRADGTRLMPGNLISSIIGRVAFPVFAAAKEDKALLKAGLRKAITMAMMLNIPLMLGMAVTARPLVVVLFGDKWLPSVPYLQILSLAGVLWPLHVLNLNVLAAQGHSNLFFRLEVIKKVYGILLIGTACFFGIVTIAWSLVLTGIFSFCVNAYYSGRLLGYGTLRQIADLLPYAGAALIMTACSWAAHFLPFTSPVWLLTAQVLVGAAVYGILCAVWRLAAFVDAWRLVRPVLTMHLLRIGR
jgi:O-antigen/teichoic acid export membrane protein